MQLGERLFTDGRQYVLDGDGRRVYGIWIVTPDVLEEAPLIVYTVPKQEGS